MPRYAFVHCSKSVKDGQSALKTKKMILIEKKKNRKNRQHESIN